MDVQERLSLEAVSAHTLVACEHRHRYEFAAPLCRRLRVLDLCCGSGYGAEMLANSAKQIHGVDNDVATIAAATATVGRDEPRISFEAADALAFLRRDDVAARFDAIVCFEGLEHLPDVDSALEELRRLAADGMRLIASVPNSRAFEEDNEFHATDFGYSEARKAFSAFQQATFIKQYLAEGSLLIVDDEATDFDARLTNRDYAEPEFANHFLVVVNYDSDVLNRAYRGRMQLAVSPVYNRYMRTLEAANADLRRRNNQLARAKLGKADSAAASFVSKLEQRVTELDGRVSRASESAAAAEAEVEALMNEQLVLSDKLRAAEAELSRRDALSVRRILGERLRQKLRS